MAIIHVEIPEELLDAMESGELSRDQLHELIELEAESVGLSFDAAVSAYRTRTLPTNPVGMDLGFLISMLNHNRLAVD